MSSRTPSKLGSLAWSLGIVVALPLVAVLAWMVGFLPALIAKAADRAGLSWAQTATGAVVLVGFVVFVGTVHAVRVTRATRAAELAELETRQAALR